MALDRHVPHPSHSCRCNLQVAELLGFDPALVMAELARRQATAAAEQQRVEGPAAGTGEEQP